MKNLKVYFYLSLALCIASIAITAFPVMAFIKYHSDAQYQIYNKKCKGLEDKYYELFYSSSLLTNFIKEKKYSKEQVVNFFTKDGICYLEDVEKDYFFCTTLKQEIPIPIRKQIDYVMELKSTLVYFIFKDNKLVYILDWNLGTHKVNIKNYLKKKGDYRPSLKVLNKMSYE
jgi:hypothetical protein